MMGVTPGPHRSVQVACFFVGQQEYGLDIMQIKEVINPIAITPVPRAPSFIEGIIELRGAILPVIDLRKRFELPAPPPGRDTKFVIAAVDGQIIGLVVDRVREVLTIDLDEVREAPSIAVGTEARFFTGVYKHDTRIILLLAVGEVLSDAERGQLRKLRGGDG
jgi:purine-binding chemotaxis protein CheW